MPARSDSAVSRALNAGRRWAELSDLAAPADVETIIAGVHDADRRAAALEVLALWEREPRPLWLDIVLFYIRLGERDRALHALQRGVDQRHYHLNAALTTTWLDPLRDDPRFDEIVAVMR